MQNRKLFGHGGRRSGSIVQQGHFAEKISRAEPSQDATFATLQQSGNLHLSLADDIEPIAWIAFPEDHVICGVLAFNAILLNDLQLSSAERAEKPRLIEPHHGGGHFV